MGSTCPVSNTFTDTRFAVPRGCHAVTTNVVKNDVRGQIEVQEPSANNGYRGELHLSDPYNGAGVFDFTITVTCQNTQASVGNAPQQNVRLSCVHNAGGQHTQPCNMGRMEVYNPHVTRPGSPGAGAWGSVCGQWTWNNNNAARVFCRELGFVDGEIYTFGHTNYLPTLPVVTGWKTCTGDEGSIQHCPLPGCVTSEDDTCAGPADPDCEEAGCVGADGLAGTADDSIDNNAAACSHEVDQGAICYNGDETIDTCMYTCLDQNGDADDSKCTSPDGDGGMDCCAADRWGEPKTCAEGYTVQATGHAGVKVATCGGAGTMTWFWESDAGRANEQDVAAR